VFQYLCFIFRKTVRRHNFHNILPYAGVGPAKEERKKNRGRVKVGLRRFRTAHIDVSHVIGIRSLLHTQGFSLRQSLQLFGNKNTKNNASTQPTATSRGLLLGLSIRFDPIRHLLDSHDARSSLFIDNIGIYILILYAMQCVPADTTFYRPVRRRQVPRYWNR
jgi:hypothetical protein